MLPTPVNRSNHPEFIIFRCGENVLGKWKIGSGGFRVAFCATYGSPAKVCVGITMTSLYHRVVPGDTRCGGFGANHTGTMAISCTTAWRTLVYQVCTPSIAGEAPFTLR